MRSEIAAVKRLSDVQSKVSCHYFIKRNGTIILMVPDNYIAWHAGKSNWKKEKSLNNKSIGIEISNKGHQYGYQNFTKEQIKSLIKLSKYLINKYKIKKTNILGHSDVAYDRKKDPGEKFPWEYLSKNNIGIWHKINKKILKEMRNKKISKIENIEFSKYLDKIGYFNNGIKLSQKKMLIKSFQRRFRQELIDGKIDKECLFIAKKLSKFTTN